MRSLRRYPALSRLLRAALRSSAIAALALAVAGCASTKNPSYVKGPPMGQPGKRVANAPIDVEDDGRPAQVVPGARQPRLPDDPSQPWSPNYGGPANPKTAPTPTLNQPPRPGRRPRTEDTASAGPAPALRDARPLPPIVRRPLTTAAAPDEVVVRAITAHEMRNR